MKLVQSKYKVHPIRIVQVWVSFSKKHKQSLITVMLLWSPFIYSHVSMTLVETEPRTCEIYSVTCAYEVHATCLKFLKSSTHIWSSTRVMPVWRLRNHPSMSEVQLELRLFEVYAVIHPCTRFSQSHASMKYIRSDTRLKFTQSESSMNDVQSAYVYAVRAVTHACLTFM